MYIMTSIAVSVWLVLTAAPGTAQAQPEIKENSVMSNAPVHFIAHLKGTRASWPDDMTQSEDSVMTEHFVYLQSLMYDRKVLLAGPSMGLRAGIVVLQVSDEGEARAIMDKDPSVVAGLHTYELYDFRASLLYGRDRLASEETDRQLRKHAVVEAPRQAVWDAWTRPEVLTTWFAPYANIELRVGGRYEILFGPPDAPLDTRGAEGCRVLSYLPLEMLSFSWNAPPSLPEARKYRSRVVLQFADAPGGGTEVTLTQLGFGPEPMWDEVYQYFDWAWGAVLTNLQKHFAGSE
ncbi:MAG: hypothetical protein Kow0074_07900 [Candidatus Zixiibacteriota bacterium]